jgi:hypothetical protein
MKHLLYTHKDLKHIKKGAASSSFSTHFRVAAVIA